MKINYKSFQLAKTNENIEDIADHFAINLINNRFAISDGVTRSFFPKVWSKILVNGFVNSKLSIKDILPEIQNEWYDLVEEIVEGENTKWFTKSQFYKEEPALATFIGLEIFDNYWKVQFIGDSYLVFIPKGVNKKKYIFSSNKNQLIFDNYPDYLSSIGNNHNGEINFSDNIELMDGTFYLMTDALAEWFFKQSENNWNQLFDEISLSNFEEFVSQKRKKYLLNDDDTTLIIIELSTQ